MLKLQDEFGVKLAEEDETGGAEGDKVIRRNYHISTQQTFNHNKNPQTGLKDPKYYA